MNMNRVNSSSSVNNFYSENKADAREVFKKFQAIADNKNGDWGDENIDVQFDEKANLGQANHTANAFRRLFCWTEGSRDAVHANNKVRTALVNAVMEMCNVENFFDLPDDVLEAFKGSSALDANSDLMLVEKDTGIEVKKPREWELKSEGGGDVTPKVYQARSGRPLSVRRIKAIVNATVKFVNGRNQEDQNEGPKPLNESLESLNEGSEPLKVAKIKPEVCYKDSILSNEEIMQLEIIRGNNKACKEVLDCINNPSKTIDEKILKLEDWFNNKMYWDANQFLTPKMKPLFKKKPVVFEDVVRILILGSMNLACQTKPGLLLLDYNTDPALDVRQLTTTEIIRMIDTNDLSNPLTLTRTMVKFKTCFEGISETSQENEIKTALTNFQTGVRSLVKK